MVPGGYRILSFARRKKREWPSRMNRITFESGSFPFEAGRQGHWYGRTHHPTRVDAGLPNLSPERNKARLFACAPVNGASPLYRFRTVPGNARCVGRFRSPRFGAVVSPTASLAYVREKSIRRGSCKIMNGQPQPTRRTPHPASDMEPKVVFDWVE